MSQPVTIRTKDNIDLAADWYPITGSSRFAILLHQRTLTKESWAGWAAALNAKGISCLAIDERGSGASTMGGKLDYQNFSDTDYRKRERDVAAVFTWLQQEQKAVESNLILVGASVGANLAIRFLADHPSVPVAIALSPGTNYFGITTTDAVKQLNSGQRAILVASDDDNGVLAGCHTLETVAPDRITLIGVSKLGHGTHMTEADPVLLMHLVAML